MRSCAPAVAFSLLCLSAPLSADMYKCIDDSGHVTYSNAPGKGCRKLVIEPAVSAPSAVPRGSAPAAFPRVDAETQRSRDAMRRRILEAELATETSLLAEARALLSEQEARIEEGERNVARRCTPLPDGGMNCTAVPGGINLAKVDERLKPFRDQVALHERNVEALNRELSALR
jgi:hypothetical protein